MRIPEQKIDEIRNTADIVDVVGRAVQLRKAGANFKGLCPFHNEKTPSFTVSPAKQIYHCFGCHAGGNVFSFLMEYNKISFVEAVQELADEYGIQIQYEGGFDKEEQSETEALHELMTDAARHYSSNLLKMPEAERARRYFEGRKIQLRTMRAFGLGYSLPDGRAIVEHLKQKGHDLKKAEHLGVISGGSSPYDKYRGRIMFPIFSPNGRVIALAGRKLEETDGGPKYINSPENKIYHKSRVLYGLSMSKDEIRRSGEALLVEGYMDLIALYQAGVKNVVAVSGTALTEEQVKLLSRYAKDVYLLFDADSAGINASMRSIETLLKQDVNVKIVSLPAGEDPDSYVNKFGTEKFCQQVEQARNFLEFQTMVFRSQGKFDSPESTAEAVKELVRPVAFINDEIKRTFLIKSLAEKFGLREALLEAELDRALAQYNKQAQRSAPPQKREPQQPQPQRAERRTTGTGAMRANEHDLMKLLLEGKSEVAAFVFQHLEPEELLDPRHISIAEEVYSLSVDEKDYTPGELLDLVDDPEAKSRINELSIEPYSISAKSGKAEKIEQAFDLRKLALDIVKRFKLLRVEMQIAECNAQISHADSDAETMELMKEHKHLSEEKTTIERDFKQLTAQLRQVE